MQGGAGIAFRRIARLGANTNRLKSEETAVEAELWRALIRWRTERRSSAARRGWHGWRLRRHSRARRNLRSRQGIGRHGGRSFFGSRRTSREKERDIRQRRVAALETDHQASTKRRALRAGRVERIPGEKRSRLKGRNSCAHCNITCHSCSSIRLRSGSRIFSVVSNRYVAGESGRAPRHHQRLGICIELALAGPIPPVGRLAPCAARRKLTTAQ